MSGNIKSHFCYQYIHPMWIVWMIPLLVQCKTFQCYLFQKLELENRFEKSHISYQFILCHFLLFVHSSFLFHSDYSEVYFSHLSLRKFNFGNNSNFLQCVNDAKYSQVICISEMAQFVVFVRHSIGLRKHNHNTMSFISILSLSPPFDAACS